MRYKGWVNKKLELNEDGGVSIIMLTRNAPEHVKLSLETLKKTECNLPLEVIVVDNASENETRQLLLNLQGGIFKSCYCLIDTYFSPKEIM